ncbi:MAG: FecR family protein [Kordiimonadaceae bacterium]|nr:FecR family protein [Kordiimonadaceae bacterium]
MKLHIETEGRVDKAAREWFTLLTSTAATDTDIEAFEQWRNQASAHAEAYQQINQVRNELGILAHTPQGEALLRSIMQEPATPSFWSRWIMGVRGWPHLPAYGAAMAAMVLVLIGSLLQPPVPAPAVYQTTSSEVRTIALDDGSLVTLGAQSHVAVHYTPNRRNIHLQKGQAFFNVARNPARPFVIKMRGAEVSVLGTKFDVHLGRTKATIAVLEGRVRVTPQQALPSIKTQAVSKPKVLTAGQVISLSDKGFTAEIKKTKTIPGAWRDGRFTYVDVPLSQIIADAGRYYKGAIILRDKSLGTTLLTTSFDVDQIDGFLRNLQDMLPINVTYTPSGKVLIKRAPELENTIIKDKRSSF